MICITHKKVRRTKAAGFGLPFGLRLATAPMQLAVIVPAELHGTASSGTRIIREVRHPCVLGGSRKVIHWRHAGHGRRKMGRRPVQARALKTETLSVRSMMHAESASSSRYTIMHAGASSAPQVDRLPLPRCHYKSRALVQRCTLCTGARGFTNDAPRRHTSRCCAAILLRLDVVHPTPTAQPCLTWTSVSEASAPTSAEARTRLLNVTSGRELGDTRLLHDHLIGGQRYNRFDPFCMMTHLHGCNGCIRPKAGCESHSAHSNVNAAC